MMTHLKDSETQENPLGTIPTLTTFTSESGKSNFEAKLKPIVPHPREGIEKVWTGETDSRISKKKKTDGICGQSHSDN